LSVNQSSSAWWCIGHSALPTVVVKSFNAPAYCKLVAFNRTTCMANIDFDKSIVEIIVS
jgi:hypothetical protein